MLNHRAICFCINYRSIYFCIARPGSIQLHLRQGLFSFHLQRRGFPHEDLYLWWWVTGNQQQLLTLWTSRCKHHQYVCIYLYITTWTSQRGEGQNTFLNTIFPHGACMPKLVSLLLKELKHNPSAIISLAKVVRLILATALQITLSILYFSIYFKGALDKSNTYLFISSSIKDCKSNWYRKFQLILPMRFHFMRYFVNSIISRVSHRLLYCVFIEVDFEK